MAHSFDLNRADIDDADVTFASVLRASTEHAIIATDVDGAIVLWNDGASRIHGYSADEVIGKQDVSIIHVPEAVAIGKHRDALIGAARLGKWTGLTELLRKTGERFAARVAITPRRNARAETIGFLVVASDVSEEIRVAQHRALSGLSHELRTPLTAIIGYAGALLMKLPGPLTERQERQLVTIEASARHLLSMLDELLTVTTNSSVPQSGPDSQFRAAAPAATRGRTSRSSSESTS